ncbi:MAG TPA: DUF5999 family protein [Streptosporangiaceae bacterium]
MCQHQPRCPQSRAPDHLAARTAAAHPGRGRSTLRNGVIVFDDGGQLLPDGRAVARAGPPRPARWPRPPEVAMTLTTPWAKARRAHENRAYVRELLRKREPAFAAALAAAGRDFPCLACPCRQQGTAVRRLRTAARALGGHDATPGELLLVVRQMVGTPVLRGSLPQMP